MKRPSPALISHWYARLRADGFRDIEGGRDLNQLHASTFRGDVQSWPDGFEPQRTLADHSTAVYYRGLSHAARALKGRKKKLVLLVSTHGAVPAADKDLASKRLGMSKRTALYQVTRFARDIGLTREAHGS